MSERYPAARVVVAVELARRIGTPEAAERLGLPRHLVLRWYRRSRLALAQGRAWPPNEAVWPGGARDFADVRPDWRARRRRYGPGLVDSLGTARRVQALYATGWRATDLAPLLGYSRSRIYQLAYGEFPRLHRDTAAAVRLLYARLAGTDGPHMDKRCRGMTARFGWAPPEAWDDGEIDNPTASPLPLDCPDGPDWVVVERLVDGHTAGLTPTLDERREAARILIRRGATQPVMAERLATDKRQIARWVDMYREAA
jgi:hypothetical protein